MLPAEQRYHKTRLRAGDAGDDGAAAPQRPALSGERRQAARRLYEETALGHKHIARSMGVSIEVLEKAARNDGWQPSRQSALLLSPAPDGLGGACPGIALCPVRTLTHRRLLLTLERRLAEAEREAPEESASDRERAVRTLAGLTRTLDRLAAMDREAAERLMVKPGQKAGKQSADVASGPVQEAPYDVDELRRALSRRLEGLLEPGSTG